MRFLSCLLKCQQLMQIDGISVYMNLQSNFYTPCLLKITELDKQQQQQQQHMSVLLVVKQSMTLNEISQPICQLVNLLFASVGRRINTIKQHCYQIQQCARRGNGEMVRFFDKVIPELYKGVEEVETKGQDSCNYRSNTLVDNSCQSIVELWRTIFPSCNMTTTNDNDDCLASPRDHEVFDCDRLQAALAGIDVTSLMVSSSSGINPHKRLTESCLGLLYFAVVRHAATGRHTGWNARGKVVMINRPYDVLHTSHYSPNLMMEAGKSMYDTTTMTDQTNQHFRQIDDDIVATRQFVTRDDLFPFESSGTETASEEVKLMTIVTIHNSVTPRQLILRHHHLLAAHFLK